MKRACIVAMTAAVLAAESLAQECPQLLNETDGSRAVVLTLGDDRVGGKVRLEGGATDREMLFSLESKRTGEFSVLKTVVRPSFFLRQTGFFTPAQPICQAEPTEVDSVVVSMHRYVPSADREVILIAHAESLAGVTVSSFDVSVPADGSPINVQRACDRIVGEFDLEKWRTETEQRLGVSGLELGGMSEAQNAECAVAVSNEEDRCVNGQESSLGCEAPTVFSSNEEVTFSSGAPVNESAGRGSKMDRIRAAFERSRRARNSRKLDRSLKRALIELSRSDVLAAQNSEGRASARRSIVVIRQLQRPNLTATQRERYLRELSRRLATLAKRG